MEIEQLPIPGLLVLKPRRFEDDRGYFVETYQQDRLAQAGVTAQFVQDNMSCSTRAGTLRGLHYQSPPYAQAKLISVIAGSILDVAVDVRKGSPTFGRHAKVELSADNGRQLWVPAGFLHGFLTLSPDTVVAYKVDNFYSAACDGSVRWDDPDLGIDWGWPADELTLSAKDAAAPLFAQFDSPFDYGA